MKRAEFVEECQDKKNNALNIISQSVGLITLYTVYFKSYQVHVIHVINILLGLYSLFKTHSYHLHWMLNFNEPSNISALIWFRLCSWFMPTSFGGFPSRSFPVDRQPTRPTWLTRSVSWTLRKVSEVPRDWYVDLMGRRSLGLSVSWNSVNSVSPQTCQITFWIGLWHRYCHSHRLSVSWAVWFKSQYLEPKRFFFNYVLHF